MNTPVVETRLRFNSVNIILRYKVSKLKACNGTITAFPRVFFFVKNKNLLMMIIIILVPNGWLLAEAS